MLNEFISLFFPNFCQACYSPLVRGEKIICNKCIVDLPKTDFHTYDENPVKLKLANVYKLQSAMAFVKFLKGGKIQRLLHKLKYERQPKIGQVLGYWYGIELKRIGFHHQVDMIIPVPLHRAKLRMRGYNQSAHFAMGLSKALEIPWRDDVIIRTVNSQTQTKKSKTERWMNVEGIFMVKRPVAILNLNLLLVDDVITTGATIESCAIELEKYCRSISVATIAMVI